VHSSSALALDQALSEQEAAQQLEQILARMDPGARAVFVLFELEGESCESIAAGLDVKLGTVYSRLRTARKSFRKQLERSPFLHAGVPMRAARQEP
jgi:RNA polymerase sigma-70 factor (ECF subfamily)